MVEKLDTISFIVNELLPKREPETPSIIEIEKELSELLTQRYVHRYGGVKSDNEDIPSFYKRIDELSVIRNKMLSSNKTANYSYVINDRGNFSFYTKDSDNELAICAIADLYRQSEIWHEIKINRRDVGIIGIWSHQDTSKIVTLYRHGVKVLDVCSSLEAFQAELNYIERINNA